MVNRSKIVLSGAIVLAAACAAQANSDGAPNIDLQKVCRASDTEIRAEFGDVGKNVFEACMSDEEGAREELVKGWAALTASDKARCVQPMSYLPSYVEWLTCLELAGDARKLRKEQAASITVGSNVRAQSLSHRTGSKGRPCPVVQWRQDGSIASVDAC
jgi:hypothetical protein